MCCFIRGVDCQLNVMEEFLDLIPLKGIATGHDLFQALENCIKKYGLLWERLVRPLTVHWQCIPAM